MSPPVCPEVEDVPMPAPALTEILPSDRLSSCHRIGSVRPSARAEPPLRVTRIWLRSAFPVRADWKMLSDPPAFMVKIWWRRLNCRLRPGGTGWLGVSCRSSASGWAHASRYGVTDTTGADAELYEPPFAELIFPSDSRV